MSTSGFFDMGSATALEELGLYKTAAGLRGLFSAAAPEVAGTTLGLAPEALKHIGLRAAGGAGAGGLLGAISAGEDNRMSGLVGGALAGGLASGGLSAASKYLGPASARNTAQDVLGQLGQAKLRPKDKNFEQLLADRLMSGDRARVLADLENPLGVAGLGAVPGAAAGLGVGLAHDRRKHGSIAPELKHVGLRALGGGLGGGAVGAYLDEDSPGTGALRGALVGAGLAGGVSAARRGLNVGAVKNMERPENIQKAIEASNLVHATPTVPGEGPALDAYNKAKSVLRDIAETDAERNAIRRGVETDKAWTGLGGVAAGGLGSAAFGAHHHRPPADQMDPEVAARLSEIMASEQAMQQEQHPLLQDMAPLQ